MSQEFSHLSPSEMLTLYMDGELPEAMQPSLFTLLSEQADLRQEMQDHFTMRRFIDNTMIMPPEAMHESIMRRVGAIAIGATLNNPISTGMMQTMATWFGKAMQPLMFVLIGAAVSGMYFGYQQENQPNAEPITMGKLNVGSQTTQPIIETGISDYQQTLGAKRNNSRSIISRDQDFTQISNIASSQKEGSSLPTFNQASSPLLEVVEQKAEPSIASTLMPDAMKEVATIDNAEKNVSPFSLTMRGFAQHSFVDQTVTPVNNPFINNLSVGLHYDISEQDAVFVEVGQESLAQRYTGTENNYTVQYNQTYLAPWAMIGWQHRFVGNQAIRPLIRVGAGGMATGPMARMTLGMEYDISKSITLIGGIEGMSTLYSYQGQWFSTQKAGITYGARISLR